MTLDPALLAQARARIQGARHILVASHVRPDGDAIGSLLGLGLGLQGAGKHVHMLLADGVPSSFRHLPGAEQVRKQPQAEIDLVITLDCADRDRLGSLLPEHTPVHINIDHHDTNTHFAELNLVDADAVAVAAMLAQHFPALGLEITQPVAENLLTGVITDTQGFRTQSVTPEALRLAADLIELGADLPQLYHLALAQKSFQAARYWGKGLAQLQGDDGLVWATLTLADRRAVGYPGSDDADLIDLLSSITGASVAVIFVEQNSRKVKVSWRAKENYDVSQVAAQFGGGGHKVAAGAMISGELSHVQDNVLRATKKILEIHPELLDLSYNNH